MTLVVEYGYLRHAQGSEQVVDCQGNGHCGGCLWSTAFLGGTFGFVCNKPSWGLGGCEFWVVVLEGGGDVIHGWVEGDTVKDELRLADFSINLIESYIYVCLGSAGGQRNMTCSQCHCLSFYLNFINYIFKQAGLLFIAR